MVLDRRSVMTQEAEGDFTLVLYLGLFVQIGQLVLQIPAFACRHKLHLNGGVRTAGSDNEALLSIFFRRPILR